MATGMRFETRTTLDCAVCDQTISLEAQEETRVEVELVGAERFSVCICCQQKVLPDAATGQWDNRYKNKWKAWLSKPRAHEVECSCKDKRNHFTCGKCLKTVVTFNVRYWVIPPRGWWVTPAGGAMCPKCSAYLNQ